VFTFHLVTDPPPGVLHHLIGGAIGRLNARESLRFERDDRGIDPWVHGIEAPGTGAGAGVRDKTHADDEPHERERNKERTHTPLLHGMAIFA